MDAASNLYIADFGNHRIRRVDSSGTISTYAGTGERSFGGDSGPAIQARLSFPRGVAVDAAGNLYITDGDGRRILRLPWPGTATP